MFVKYCRRYMDELEEAKAHVLLLSQFGLCEGIDIPLF